MRKLIVALLVAVLGAGGVAYASSSTTGEVIVSAHRGGAGQWPQNSMLAFREALNAHYDEIEADTWLTRDGYSVIYHDETISASRCPGPLAGKPVHSLTLAQVRTIRCAGQPIPRASDLAKLVASYDRTVLRIEVKHFAGQPLAQAEAWDRSVSRLLVTHKLTKRAIVEDFDWPALAQVHRVAPEIHTSALIVEPTHAAIVQARRIGAGDVSYDARYERRWRNAYIERWSMVPVMWGVDPLPARPEPVTGLQAQAIERSLCSAIDSGARVVITNYPAIDATARDGCS